MNGFYAVVGAIVMMALVIVGGALMGGWALTILWGWFVVPTFHLPQLGVVPAIGIAMVVSYLAKQDIDVKSPERTRTERISRVLALTFARPLFTLAAGWVVHLFMGAAS